MNPWQRFWIGGGGALLPLLVTLLAVDLASLVDHYKDYSIGTYVGTAARYLVLFAVGGIVAALNSDESQPIKLVQLGIAAPALIASYVNAQPPKPITPQAHVARTGTFSLELIPSAYAGEAMQGRDGRIFMADFFSDVFRSATSTLPRVPSPPHVPPPPPPPPPVPNKAAVDQAIENATSAAANSAMAVDKAAAAAATLDSASPEDISALQKSIGDAKTAAQKAQSDIKSLSEITKADAPR
jgi:hypothetical protein